MKLKIPLITELIERRARGRLRSIMRGHRLLKESNQLGLIDAVKEQLSSTPISHVAAHASAPIFGAGNNAELIVRQYLLPRIASYNLNRSLLCSLGRPGSAVVHPLPREWRKVLPQHGFKIAGIWSALAWNGFVALMLAYGMVSIAKRVFASIKEIVRPAIKPLGRFAYFDGLTADCLPQPCNDGHSYDILSWYRHWPERVPELDTLCHNVSNVTSSTLDGTSVVTLPSPITPLTSLSSLIRYVVWGLAASMEAFADVFRDRWWHAVLLNEAGKSAQVRLQNPDLLARDYLFHNSGWIYRPLWTYEAERHGSRICFYFYSTNCESFKLPGGYRVQSNGWQVMSWPLYLVWDGYQADFVRRAVGTSANISIVGSIDFTDSSLELKQLSNNSFGVFDVQPVRESFYPKLGAAFDYYTPGTCNQFLIDICGALRGKNATLVHKRKRNIGKLAHYEYRNLIRDLEGNTDYINIDSRISAKRIIANCVGVISMPFTSTALLGRELGKPSIYYDPHGLIQKDDRSAHGIPIITGVAELRDWVSTVLSQ